MASGNRLVTAAGAAAEEGRSLDECLEVAVRMERNMATLAVAVSKATHPATGEPISEIAQGEMVIGMGQHGEKGTGAQELKSADETAKIMVPMLLDDIGVCEREEVLFMINGVGSTTLMELYVVLGSVERVLKQRKVKLARSLAGEFLTVQEMGGFQMCMARMDADLLKLWDAPCSCPALVKK